MRKNTLLLLIAMLIAAVPALAAEKATEAVVEKPAEKAAEAPAAEKAAAPEVARAQFTTEVSEREPVDDLTEIAQGTAVVFFFTEIKNAANTTITHRWLLDGATIAEVGLKIGGNRWRTRSSKKIAHLAAGTLEVQVVDQQGKVMLSKTMSIKAAEKAVAAPVEAPSEKPAEAPSEKPAE